MERVKWENVKITGGFWKEKQDLIREVTMQKVYDRFADRIEALKCDKDKEKHIFWDSDVAKWMEAAAYVLAEHSDPELEAKLESMIDDIEKNQLDDGYYNSYYISKCLDQRFTNRSNHELYCAGHFMEAAVEYYRATGRTRFLKIMCRYADLIEKIFVKEKSAAFLTSGHEEIELALVKLYEATGEKRYLELSKYFVETRGTEEDREKEGCSQIQAHVPVREQKKAVGHAVRAEYLYSAMADLARLYDDPSLAEACKTLFDNIVNTQMYITGATGSAAAGECFTFSYDLPNEGAYAETCANLALALFARRMELLDVKSVYADIVERVMYNGFLAGISLDGRKFYYSCPQEIDLERYNRPVREFRPSVERVELFGCSCCPPNVLRFVSSIQDSAYTVGDGVIYVQQYFTSEADIGGAHISVESGFPFDGKVRITYKGEKTLLALRVPSWCREFSGNISENGYAYYPVSDGDTIEVDFPMKPYLVEADPRVSYDCGRAAVQRGPLVYCLESVDNGDCLHDIIVDSATLRDCDGTIEGTVGVRANAYRRCADDFDNKLYRPIGAGLKPCEAVFIPYYSIENRGNTSMLIWVRYK